MTRLFGTNGIRGIVNQEMNNELALGIGKAWGTYLKQTITTTKACYWNRRTTFQQHA